MLSLIETHDGSLSLFSEKFGVGYHSKYGAVRESRHVFIEAGLFFLAILKKEMSILEIGFGTGLNGFLTFLEAEKLGLNIRYTAVEGFPISLELAAQLKYPSFLNAQGKAGIFDEMHRSEWGAGVRLGEKFLLEKKLSLFESLDYDPQFDLIFFDAFAPQAQPELWGPTLLQKMYEALLPGGILVTYCAMGAFKRTLKAVGFEVEALKGPPGKREMTRGQKPDSSL